MRIYTYTHIYIYAYIYIYTYIFLYLLDSLEYPNAKHTYLDPNLHLSITSSVYRSIISYNALYNNLFTLFIHTCMLV